MKDKDFVIITEGTCDLPAEYCQKEGIEVIPMAYTIDGKTYMSGEEGALTSKQFIAMLRGGKMPTTALVSPLTAKEAAEKYLAKGINVLYIAFSSALSGSCQSAQMAAKELEGKHLARMVVVDSLNASMGEGMLVYYAAAFKRAGNSFEDTCIFTENAALRVSSFFTANDLFHLYRGGRVTKGKAIVGTLLKIKPLLYVDPEGKLIPVKNCMGRKNAIHWLCDSMADMRDEDTDTVFISHADAPEHAELLKKLVSEKYGIKNYMISDIGPIIATHAGPDTVAMFFLGKQRRSIVG